MNCNPPSTYLQETDSDAVTNQGETQPPRGAEEGTSSLGKG